MPPNNILTVTDGYCIIMINQWLLYQFLMKEATCMKRISLSWLVVSTRHYIKEYDWYINSNKGYCTGCLKEEGKEGLYKNKGGTDFETFILMPELQDYSMEAATEMLRNWCMENNIPFKEDLDNYKTVERSYWGYDDFNILRVGV